MTTFDRSQANQNVKFCQVHGLLPIISFHKVMGSCEWQVLARSRAIANEKF